jgi:hypothetical protein
MILNVHCQFYAKQNINSEDCFKDILCGIPEELKNTYSTRQFFFPVTADESERISKEGIFVINREGTDEKCFIIDEIIVSFHDFEGCNLEETIEYTLSFFKGRCTSYDLLERVHVSSPN